MSTNALREAAATSNQPRAVFPSMIEQLKKQVSVALPKHLNADRMARIALTEFNKNPKLAECNPRSVFAAVVIASQLGIEPGVLGQGYLIPYGKDCQFVPGWKGLVDLAQRSGRSSVWTGAVFQGDDFEYAYGSEPRIHHVPKGEEDPKKLTHVYAVGRIRGAEFPIIEVWTMGKVWAHRDRFNKVGNRHYSYQHPEMYARKIPLLQVLKYMPASIELATAIDLENAAETSGQSLDLEAAINGEFVHIPPEDGGQAGGGDRVPMYDKASAIAALKATKTKPELDKLYGAIKEDFSATQRDFPVDIEAAWKDRGEALNQL